VIFLGDMYDGITHRRYKRLQRTTWTPGEYESLQSRWKWIFDSDVPFYNVSGNHDVGFNIPFGQDELVETYKRNFGDVNYLFTIGDVDFIVIAATALHPGWTHKPFYEETENFLEKMKQLGTLLY